MNPFPSTELDWVIVYAALIIGGLYLLAMLISALISPPSSREPTLKDVNDELHYQATGYMPGEHPYKEKFNPSKVPNELMPETWNNGPYRWNPQTRRWELRKR